MQIEADIQGNLERAVTIAIAPCRSRSTTGQDLQHCRSPMTVGRQPSDVVVFQTIELLKLHKVTGWWTLARIRGLGWRRDHRPS
jgi:hypothetical protein